MIRLCSIASGSSGNCIYIGTEDTHVLVDAGISAKKIEEGLALIGVKPAQLSGIFITHEHSDHIKGLQVFTKKYAVPVYATKHTLDAYLEGNKLDLAAKGKLNIVECGQSVRIGSLEAMPFPVSHDAVMPVNYTFTDGKHKVGLATDLGCYNNTIVDALSGAEILYLEANHDVNMLLVGGYPYKLKLRVLSDRGHLSNDAAAELILRLLHKDLQHIILGHLSKNNNYPELAYETVHQEVKKKWSFSTKIPDIFVADRDRASRILQI